MSDVQFWKENLYPAERLMKYLISQNLLTVEQNDQTIKEIEEEIKVCHTWTLYTSLVLILACFVGSVPTNHIEDSQILDGTKYCFKILWQFFYFLPQAHILLLSSIRLPFRKRGRSRSQR